jgi:hypothetical protein
MGGRARTTGPNPLQHGSILLAADVSRPPSARLMERMIFGEQKVKELARSILPSTWRRAGKARASLHRASRHLTRRALRALTRDPSAWDEGVEFGDEDAEVSLLVSRRRGADKLNHFIRWAVERTQELPKESRLGHLRAVLPGGLIGQHALLHLERSRQLAPRAELVSRRWLLRREPLFLDPGLVAEVLREVLQVHEGAQAVHQALKAARRERETRWAAKTRQALPLAFRPLGGAHDVLDFLRWLQTDLGARHVVDLFCREFRLSGDVHRAFAVASALAVLPAWVVPMG